MWIGKCIGICIGICIDMRIGMCTDMCTRPSACQRRSGFGEQRLLDTLAAWWLQTYAITVSASPMACLVRGYGRRGDHFERRRVHTRVLDTPSAMARWCRCGACGYQRRRGFGVANSGLSGTLSTVGHFSSLPKYGTYKQSLPKYGTCK